MTNLRKYTRLPLDVMVELQLTDETRFYGETADISLDGAFVILSTVPNLKTGQNCHLILILKTGDGWVRVSFESTIAHMQDEGIGIRFNGASINHHESFLKLLIEGTSDIDILLEELSHYTNDSFQYSDL